MERSAVCEQAAGIKLQVEVVGLHLAARIYMRKLSSELALGQRRNCLGAPSLGSREARIGLTSVEKCGTSNPWGKRFARPALFVAGPPRGA